MMTVLFLFVFLFPTSSFHVLPPFAFTDIECEVRTFLHERCDSPAFATRTDMCPDLLFLDFAECSDRDWFPMWNAKFTMQSAFFLRVACLLNPEVLLLFMMRSFFHIYPFIYPIVQMI